MRTVFEVRAWDTARLVRAGSAVAVGGFGWLLAHVVTFWFIAHSHHGALSLTARHVHSYAAAVAAAAGGLAVVALLAVVVTARRPAPPMRRRRPVHRAVALSMAAFLAADAVEHAALGLEHTPPALMLLGAGLHALSGALSSLLWLRFAEGVEALLAPFRPPAAASTAPRIPVEWRPRRARRLLWADAVAGRAPPIG